MTDPSARPNHLGFTLEGERVRRASGILEREATQLATAVRRSLPFVARRGLPVTLRYTRATPIGNAVAELPRPIFTLPMNVAPGDSRGAIVFDARAISLVLDGALGGDGRALPTLNANGLTAAQSALMARVAASVVQAMSDMLNVRIGVQMKPARPDPEEGTSEGALIACALEVGEPAASANIVLLLPKEALIASDRGGGVPQLEPGEDPRVAAVLGSVDLELVAELGRIPVRLAQLASLKVGDTLRLDVQVGSSVTLRADGRPVLHGRPTTSGGRIAIKIDRHEG